MFGVYVIVLARHCHRTALVIQLREAYFCRQLIAQVPVSELFARLGTLASGVSGLYHEVGNDPVKQQTVIEMCLDKADEVVAVLRCEVGKGYPDVAFRSFEQHCCAAVGAWFGRFTK